MKFNYSSNLYRMEIFLVTGLAAAAMITLNIYKYFTAAGVIGAVAVFAVMRFAREAEKREQVTVEICEDFFKYIHKNEHNHHETKFWWMDIDSISEDKQGMVLRVKNDPVEVLIEKRIGKYKELKEIIHKKARSHSIPIIN